MLDTMRFSFPDQLSKLFAGLVDGLCDPSRRRRVALALTAAYAAAWFLYGLVAKSSQDINADMAEMVIWAQEPALGYPKHPPLLAYVVKLWFSIFPCADWAFILLAVLTVSAGIFVAFELSGIWLDREKRAAVPFLLAVIPFYNFLGLKFDQNSALIPLWALAMLTFMRSLETQLVGWAALTGLIAAAAMLTKYWSGFLLAALAVTALLNRRRDAYFRSAAPWVTAFVFLAVVLPHVIWLIHADFPPMRWVETRRVAHSTSEFVRSLAVYSGGTIAYAFAALGLVAVLVHPPIKAVRDSWFAGDPARRAATLLFWTPLLLPFVVALAIQTNLQSIWNGPSLNLLPVMMLASPLVKVPRLAVMRLAAIVTAFTLTAVVLSPLVSYEILKRGVENNAAYTRLAAAAAEREWRESTSAPLRLLGGPFTLVSSAAFYMQDQPSTYADFSSYLSPWVDEARIERDGMAIVCPADNDECLRGMQRLTDAGPPGRHSEITLTRHWLGFSGSAERFVIATIPPRS